MTRKRSNSNQDRESLIISFEAYRKLLYFRNNKDTEVGAMAITDADDPLRINDFEFLPQECTVSYTEFDEDEQTNWMEDKMEAGLSPENFCRIWTHTHPGNSANPSGTDWDTFSTILGNMPWAVMLILSKNNEFTCVFRYREQSINIPVAIETEAVPQEWMEELDNVKKRQPPKSTGPVGKATRRTKKSGVTTIWGTSCSSADFNKFREPYAKLTGYGPYSNNVWNPDFMEILASGPCRALDLLSEIALNSTDKDDLRKYEGLAETLGKLLADEEELILNYDEGIAEHYCPLVLLNSLRSSKATLKEYAKERGIQEDVTKYIVWDNDKNQYCVGKGYYAQVPHLFASSNPQDHHAALYSCIASVMHYTDYPKLIDKACTDYVNQFISEQEEYIDNVNVSQK